MDLRILACKRLFSCASMLVATRGRSASMLGKQAFSAQAPQVHNTL
jgi:hypothetical protein